MPRSHRKILISAAAGFSAILGTLAGCETQSRKAAPAATPTSNPAPAAAVAQSDTERAKAALERDRQARAAERRPHEPQERRVVDQPRVAPRRP